MLEIPILFIKKQKADLFEIEIKPNGGLAFKARFNRWICLKCIKAAKKTSSLEGAQKCHFYAQKCPSYPHKTSYWYITRLKLKKQQNNKKTK